MTQEEIQRFDAYEIAPVYECTEKNYCEPCRPGEESFWTLYGHIKGEGALAIFDGKDRQACEDMLFRITGHREYTYTGM